MSLNPFYRWGYWVQGHKASEWLGIKPESVRLQNWTDMGPSLGCLVERGLIFKNLILLKFHEVKDMMQWRLPRIKYVLDTGTVLSAFCVWFSPHNKPTRTALLLPSVYKGRSWRQWGEVTCPASHTGRSRPKEAFLLSIPGLFHLTIKKMPTGRKPLQGEPMPRLEHAG